MLTFAMKGNTSDQVNAAHSHTPLEIKGHFHCQGPQIVGGEGGAPTWVYDLFESNPKLTSIALSTDTGGVVYAPMKACNKVNTTDSAALRG